MKTKDLKQTISFSASPHEVYEALMDSKKHSEFTGGKATISRKVGGKFSVYDNYAQGKNIELVADKKIVQSWRAGDWPQGADSKVTFSLSAKRGGGTKLSFTHKGIPAEQYADIKEGWSEFYWKPMKSVLGL